ncbi:hypothetical protein [Chondromyces crocatus]|uniref:HEAT repeat domain-containing protein n=1 Tax=Chondromyces crocatus TaxID=52 RepID=A0A0K1EG01_CHOCO|nr:hypothetical protein [Chondromyces crocatus]AKT39800.1 uncharacterized protein CMC5_039510 [Chondromyces crocatus]
MKRRLVSLGLCAATAASLSMALGAADPALPSDPNPPTSAASPPGVPGAPGAPAALPALVGCSLPAMVDTLRGALKDGSPALQRYMKFLIKEAALAMPPEELSALFAGERDPGLVEALGVALATRASNTRDFSLLDPVIDRARAEADPKLRAAALGGMRGIASVEVLQQKRISYEDFMRDPSPEVRDAAVENLLHENSKIYFGHDRGVSEAAVKAASACSDPKTAAKLLSGTSMEQVGPDAVQTLVKELRSEHAEVRAAAAKALGGVPAASAGTAERALITHYPGETTTEVRAAMLEGIVHLRLGGAVPILESLRGIDSTLGPDIDAWLKALSMNLQEWSLVLREKQRIKP